MSKILKNQTGSPVVVGDTGVTLPASPSTYTIPPQDFPLWAASAAIDTLIDAITVIVNDGYDDLKPEWGKRHLHEESLPRSSALISASAVQATAASTLTLLASSRLLYIFTGTTAGQIVKLPNATTLQIGHRYEIWNTSTQFVDIQNNGAGAVFSLSSFQKTWLILQDNSTSDGTWLIEANFLGGSGSGSGAVIAGFDGNAGSGRWLETVTNVPTNTTPIVIAGVKAIRAFSIGAASSATATITIYKNAVALDTISLSAQTKNSKLNLNHVLANLDTLSMQVTSGSCSRPVLALWL